MLTLTIANSAVGELAKGYAELTGLLSESFTKRSWLTGKAGITGYARAIELTYNTEINSWNLHAHILITGDDAQKSSDKILTRWQFKAAEMNINVHASAQDSRNIPVKDIPKTLAYIFKQHALYESRNSSSLSPGNLLRLAAHGDMEFVDLIHEYETASKGVHTRTSGGILKASTVAALKASAPDA
ncbi:hypothetical protein FHX72_001128 [Pseudoclavibacter helvolus]|uniref:Replication protein n=1 Tax=Pseudoclavibacter helvolus TaxID=255205 RepID=A0A7W4YFH0_9MICO|nr:hypothetical protein [Pseudoclavibacter helvolus]